jgi:hypothetical protein
MCVCVWVCVCVCVCASEIQAREIENEKERPRLGARASNHLYLALCDKDAHSPFSRIPWLSFSLARRSPIPSFHMHCLALNVTLTHTSVSNIAFSDCVCVCQALALITETSCAVCSHTHLHSQFFKPARLHPEFPFARVCEWVRLKERKNHFGYFKLTL